MEVSKLCLSKPSRYSAPTFFARILFLENEISNLVNEAYGLTPEVFTLMWQTVPPRMPIMAPLVNRCRKETL